jgi:prepilin-type N-terminal cleavage/methylation domain-containing protein
MTGRRPRSDAGFSLLELVVGLGVLALLLALLPGSLRLGQRTFERTAMIEAREGHLATRAFLGASLAEAMPLYVSPRTGGTGLAFRGTALTLEFIAPSAAGPTGGGLYRYRLSVQPIPGRREAGLTLTMAPFRPGGEAERAGEARVLAEGPDGAVGFRYFGRIERRGEAPPQWTPEWPRSDALPDLVEVSFGPDAEGQPRPPLVIALRLRPAA